MFSAKKVDGKDNRTIAKISEKPSKQLTAFLGGKLFRRETCRIVGGKPFDSDFSCVIESVYFSSRAVLYR